MHFEEEKVKKRSKVLMIIFAILFFISHLLYAQPSERTKLINIKFQEDEMQYVERNDEIKKITFGFSSGLYFIQDDNFQELYGKNVTYFRGEYSSVLPIPVEYLDLWIGISYFQKSGQTSLTEEDLKFSLWTFSYALRYLKKVSSFTPFLGSGVDFIVYKEIYPEDFIISSSFGKDLGFHVQAGVYIHFLSSLSAKLHVKYNLAKTTLNDVEVDLGGIECGIGLIYHFGR